MYIPRSRELENASTFGLQSWWTTASRFLSRYGIPFCRSGIEGFRRSEAIVSWNKKRGNDRDLAFAITFLYQRAIRGLHLVNLRLCPFHVANYGTVRAVHAPSLQTQFLTAFLRVLLSASKTICLMANSIGRTSAHWCILKPLYTDLIFWLIWI